VFAPDRTMLAALVDEHSTRPPLWRAKALCVLCKKLSGVTGVALSVAGGKLSNVTSTVCGTDELSMRLPELQMGLAEGPIADALDSTFPVLASDLTDVSHVRWLWFAPAAVQAGAAAAFVLPVGDGETPLGALSLYRSTSGDLTAQQYDDFRALADAAAEILCSSSGGDEPGSWTVGEGTGFQPEIHQALGAIITDLGVDAEHALARLRGYTFASGQTISEAAHDILSRRLRLDPDAA